MEPPFTFGRCFFNRTASNNMKNQNGLTIQVPGDVRWIMETLKGAGHEAYIVGGCVRDAILETEPKDWDITTSALPGQVKSLFPRTVDTGIQHGTVMVIRRGTGYEVTTYRVDGEYKDGRHPETVTFTRSLEEDLKRRDFTINALAYSPEEGIVDLFGGMEDLAARKIRCVRDPDERFSEDALRIMRAIRFSAQLSFAIEQQTLDAVRNHADDLSKVSAERIREEFEKTLLSQSPERVNLFSELGMEAAIIPDKACAARCFDPGLSGVYTAFQRDETNLKVLRLAVFFSNLNAEETRRVLRLLKYDNKTITLVSGIIEHKCDPLPESRAQLKRAWKGMGRDLFFLTLSFREAFAETGQDAGFLEAASKVRCEGADIAAANEAYLVSQLALNGSDLIAAGIPAGRQIGELLDTLTEEVIEHPDRNEKEFLLRKAAEAFERMQGENNGL